MKIYIARHGETEWNKQGIMQGWLNSPLTAKGIENAKRLGEKLHHIDFDYVCCSPLGRAAETASYLTGDKSPLLIYNSCFKEMGFGIWEGMRHEDIKELFPIHQYNYWNAPHMYKPLDGESYKQFLERVEKGLNTLIQYFRFENLLLVTHAAVIKAIFHIVYKRSLEDFWAPPFVHDTCLSVLEILDGDTKVLLESDISHLD